MKEEIVKEIVNNFCSEFFDNIMTGIEESKEDFPFTIACANFLTELKSKGKNFDLKMLLENTELNDYLYYEMSQYLADEIELNNK